MLSSWGRASSKSCPFPSLEGGLATQAPERRSALAPVADQLARPAMACLHQALFADVVSNAVG